MFFFAKIYLYPQKVRNGNVTNFDFILKSGSDQHDTYGMFLWQYDIFTKTRTSWKLNLDFL